MRFYKTSRIVSRQTKLASRLVKLLPKTARNLKETDIEDIVSSLHLKYEKMMCNDGKTLFYNEVLLWKQKWRETEDVPTDVLSALDSADRGVYPAIHLLLKILAVLPVSIRRAFVFNSE